MPAYEEKTCESCGEPFTVFGVPAYRKTRRYCNRSCGAKGNWLARLGDAPRGVQKSRAVPGARKGRPPRAEREIRSCKQCGNTWEAYAWENQGTQNYCSSRCWGDSRIGQPALSGTPPEERACVGCGKAFVVGGAKGHARSVKHCSIQCFWERGSHGIKKHSIAVIMTEGDAKWMAGLFDGEGSVAWPRRTSLHSVRIDITNTHRPLLEKVMEVTGTGRINVRPVKQKAHNQAWVWSCFSTNSLSILRQMYPFLLVKKEAAAIALGIVEATAPPTARRTRKMSEAMTSLLEEEAA